MAYIKDFAENGGQILTFTAADSFYAFQIMDVADIIEIPEITVIPKTPPYLLGIMNHRGKAVPVMDFRLRLGLPEGEYDDRSCVIVLEINTLQCGIRVDRVSDVEYAFPAQIAVSPAEKSMVSCFITMENKRISLIDTDRLVRG